MPYDLSVYDEAFFSTNQWEGLRHAEWFVPLLQEIFAPRSIVDVGCGTGHFGPKARTLGIEYVGLEGSQWAVDHALDESVIQMDFRQPGFATTHCRKFDVALSIEVAEHIEGEFAGRFVETLCALSDTVVLTAARPGQGGTMHVNEAPRQYWLDLFASRGFKEDVLHLVELRMGIDRAVLGGFHVASWWYKNVMCFRRRVDAQAI